VVTGLAAIGLNAQVFAGFQRRDERLRAFAYAAERAPQVIYALTLDADAQVREKQLRIVEKYHDAAMRAGAAEQLTSLLVFRAGSTQPKAVPLALVTRLEEIAVDKIEFSNGRYMVQYRDRLMPLVQMDGVSVGTSGALAPSAVLSTGQSLVVTTTSTAGQPAHFVNSHRKPKGANHQLLLSFTLPGDIAPGSHTILVTAYEGDQDSDQWYWPITVLAIPPAVPYTIAGSITTPLYPGGAPSPINLSFLNPNPGNGGSGAIGVQVSSLTATVSAVSAPSATSELPCTVSDFAVTQFSGTYPFVIPQGKSSLRSLGFAQGTWPAVRLVDRPVNQNGCRGATLTIAYSGAS